MSTRDAVGFLASRAATFGLYVLAVGNIGLLGAEPDSWREIGFRLIGGAAFTYWAVNRSIQHWHDDMAHDRERQR